MGMSEFTESVKKNGIDILFNEPMSRHTTFRIGGNADVFINIETEEELILCCVPQSRKTYHILFAARVQICWYLIVV